MTNFQKRINELVKEVAKREGKKVSVSRGNILEIGGIFADLYFESWGEIDNLSFLLAEWGAARAKKRKKAKKK